MANTPGGSFIPKRSTGKIAPTHSGRRIYIFSYIAYVLFFGSLLSVAGIFFLNQQAERQLNEHISEVAEAQKSINRGQLESIRELDNRLQAADQILNQHAAPSVIFEALESVIVSDIQLGHFSYLRENGNGAELSIGGLSNTFDVLLFQRDVMKSNTLLASADFVEVSYGAETNPIEGADRNNENSVNRNIGDATVTFTFVDDTVLANIGYKPRENDTSVIIQEEVPESNESVPDSETVDVVE